MVERFLRNQARSRPPAKKWGWRCLSEEILAAYADGRLPEHESARVDHHLADCGYCREQVTFLVSRSGDAAGYEVPIRLLARAEALATKGTTVNPAWRWATATAVTACLVLVVSYRMQEQDLDVVFAPPGPPVMESTPTPTETAPEKKAPDSRKEPRTLRGGESTIASVQMLWPEDGAIISGAKDFRWEPVTGTLFYEVRLTTAAGDPVWQSERMSTTRAAVPPSIHFKPGQKYFVWVVAHLQDGKTIRSRAVAFSVGN